MNRQKSISIFILLLINLSTVFAQKQGLLIPYRIGHKWGVADESGRILIKPNFESTYPALTDRIRFKQGENFGFIDTLGEIVIEPVYSNANDFYSFGGMTYSYVTMKDSRFFIDVNGNPIILSARCGGGFSNMPNDVGVFKLNGKYGLKTLRGDTILQPVWTHIKNYNDGYVVVARNSEFKYGILGVRGDTIYGFSLDSVEFDISNWSARYYRIYDKGKVGALDIGGYILAKPEYENLTPYSIEGKLVCFYAKKRDKILGYIYKGREFWGK